MHERLFSYWGKAKPRNDGPAWHPLVYHSLDVAAAGEALLVARPKLLEAISVVSGVPIVDVPAWMNASLALHDLGKFSDAFQSKAPELWAGRARFEIERRTTFPTLDPGHDLTGSKLWRGQAAELSALGFGREGRAGLSEWVIAACGHHGRPVDDAKHVLSNLVGDTSMGDAGAFVLEILGLFRPSAAPAPDEAGYLRSSILVAGVAVMADWLGSNQRWFPYVEPGLALPEYWERARQQALAAVGANGLVDVRGRGAFTLADALPSGATATPLQAWAADRRFDEPSLIFIEDLTGAGKTEAAVMLAHRLIHAGLAEGFYWALPTMATADGLYERLASSYQKVFAEGLRPSLVLAHGARDLHDAFLGSIAEPAGERETFAGREEAALPDGTASATCAAWIADDRRTAFLAQVGVGTIDQALLAVLPVKHQPLRLAALARRVLVVDEAHAFDAYQNRLLEHLLKAHATMGGSAVVLSATLPLRQRASLANAFAGGLGLPAVETHGAAFPLATTLSRAGISEQPLGSRAEGRRDLPVRRLEDPAQAVAMLMDATAQGSCAVWIRNTVQDVLDAAEALRSEGADLLIFHARFALVDRLARQAEILQLFGKSSTPEQRRGRLLLATQVVEQSLDLDFDAMISDLAPIDLLIQRAGRLQRHSHRPARPDPRLMILGPGADPSPDRDWYARAFDHAQWVYPDHGRLWLTQRTLEAFGGLPLLSRSPRDLIEAVYGEDAGEAIPNGLQMRTREAEGVALSERSIGGLNGIEIDKGFRNGAGAWRSDEITPTRLGAETRTCRLARWDGSTLRPWAEAADPRRAWRMSEISLRASRVAAGIPPDPACAAAMEATVARWPERRYPPLLLPLVEREGYWKCEVVNDRADRTTVAYGRDDGLRFVVGGNPVRMIGAFSADQYLQR